MITLDQQIACVRREIAMRNSVYRKRVADGKMRQSEASYEVEAMTAVLEMLTKLRDCGGELATPPTQGSDTI